MEKVAVSSTGQTLQDLVDPRFGRCPFIGFADIDNGKITYFESFANPGIKNTHGAGINTANFVVNKKANTVITGNLGPNAYNVLNASGIGIYQAIGCTIEKALADYINGNLTALTSPGLIGRGIGLGRGMGRSGRQRRRQP